MSPRARLTRPLNFRNLRQARDGTKFGLFAQGLYISANAVTFVIRFLLFNYLIFANHTTTSIS